MYFTSYNGNARVGACRAQVELHFTTFLRVQSETMSQKWNARDFYIISLMHSKLQETAKLKVKLFKH